jgi:hypothetical protein
MEPHFEYVTHSISPYRSSMPINGPVAPWHMLQRCPRRLHPPIQPRPGHARRPDDT